MPKSVAVSATPREMSELEFGVNYMAHGFRLSLKRVAGDAKVTNYVLRDMRTFKQMADICGIRILPEAEWVAYLELHRPEQVPPF